MKRNPPRRTESVNYLVIISGGITTGTEVKRKKVDRNPDYQQQGGNPLQEPRPETTFFYIHYCNELIYHKDAKDAEKINKELTGWGVEIFPVS